MVHRACTTKLEHSESEVVPEAGVEPAWISPNDFESFAYSQFRHSGNSQYSVLEIQPKSTVCPTNKARPRHQDKNAQSTD